MKRVLLAVLFGMLAVTPALAQGGRPFQIRLEGYVGDPPAGVTPPYSWTVSYEGKIYKLQVIKHESLSTGQSTMDINNRVIMNNPNFYLGGDEKAIKVFTTAKPGQLIKIMADMILGDDRSQLALDTVTPVEAGK